MKLHKKTFYSRYKGGSENKFYFDTARWRLGIVEIVFATKYLGV